MSFKDLFEKCWVEMCPATLTNGGLIMAPFKSQSQARYMFAKKPKLAKEFAEKTKSIKALPEHAKKKVKKKK